MVRRCIVKNCKSTDLNTLSHRFPRNPKLNALWMKSLELYEYSVKNIYDKFVVCSFHFNESDYRNPTSNRLNVTAVPKLTTHSRNRRQNSAQIRENNPPTMVKQANKLVELVDAKTCLDRENKNDFADEDDVKSGTFETVTMILDNESDDEYDSKSEITMNNSIYDVEILDVEENDDNIENDTESNQEFIEYSEYYENNGDQIGFSVETCNNESSSIELEVDPCIQYEDAASQFDSDELERNDSNEVYSNLTREDLINELNRSQLQVSSLTTQLENVQCAHSKLLQNVEALKYLMGP